MDRGSSVELGKRSFKSTNSLFQMLSFSLAETVPPRGTQSVNCICEPVSELLPAGSPVKTSSRRAPSAEAGTMVLACRVLELVLEFNTGFSSPVVDSWSVATVVGKVTSSWLASPVFLLLQNLFS